jgi:hypothetical protein
MMVIRCLAVLLTAVALGAVIAAPAAAESPARERELTCSDGTTFTGEQVRQGGGRPPHTWRNVSPGTFPAAFTFHATTVTAPDGTVVESETWDNTHGVERNQELVTCSFIIPIGPLAGHRVDFEGFFVPVQGSR